MIHIYLPFAKLIQLACCTARQQSGEPNTPTNIRCRECCHSIYKQRRCNCPILGCRDLAEQMNKGYIRSRNNNRSSYDENLNEKRGTEKSSQRDFEPTNSRLYLGLYIQLAKRFIFFFSYTPRSKVNHFPNRARLIPNQPNNPFTRFTASSFLRLMILAYTCVIFTSVCPSNFEVVYKSAPSVSIIVANVCRAV